MAFQFGICMAVLKKKSGRGVGCQPGPRLRPSMGNGKGWKLLGEHPAPCAAFGGEAYESLYGLLELSDSAAR